MAQWSEADVDQLIAHWSDDKLTDREKDAYVCWFFADHTFTDRETEEIAKKDGALAAFKHFLGKHIKDSGSEQSYAKIIPRFYTSVDAALGLLGAHAPDCGYRLMRQYLGGNPVCTLFAPPEEPNASIDDGRSWSKQYAGAGPNPAAAIVAALLNILKARAALPPQR